MTSDNADLRVLAPRAVARRLSRRQFLGAAGATAGLVACGTSDDAPVTQPTTAGPTGQPSAATTSAAPAVLEKNLNIYTWAEYHSPDNQKAFTKDLGPKVKVDVYDSNEAMIAKLELAKGSAGYDIVVPTGAFIPQMVAKGLLMELDKSKIANFANLETQFLDQPWDKGNTYSVVKDWGSTGYVYDAKAVKDEPKTWGDFMTAAAKPGVSGKVSVLGAPGDVTGIYFWANGIPWTTEKKEDLDACEKALVDNLAPHIKAFDSYPVAALVEGSFVLSQAWNGDARAALIEADDPDRYKWVLGAPKTELWVDTWAILKSAKNVEAAHAWINFILDPEVSATEIDFHGYNTAVKGTREMLGDKLKLKELIYFTDEEISRLDPGVVNSAQDRLVAIFNKVKAAAGK